MKELKNFTLTLTTRRMLDDKINQLLSANPNIALTVNISQKAKKRSLPANAVYWSWLPVISDFIPTPMPEAKRWVKLEFGLPILLSHEYLGPIIGNGLSVNGFFELSYKDKLFEMEQLPVTRLFDTKMHNKLRDDLQFYFADHGLILEYKK